MLFVLVVSSGVYSVIFAGRTVQRCYANAPSAGREQYCLRPLYVSCMMSPASMIYRLSYKGMNNEDAFTRCSFYKCTTGSNKREPLTLNYWVFGLFPSSGIVETRQHDVSETGCVSVLRCGGKIATQLRPFYRAKAVVEIYSV
jgi:hypothetical protein